uniref:J domain-containing protein n=1 Tax=Bionectria ochroleuca TaxID=29856 RepID=A0A8H7NA95_BIOOC
MGTSVLIEPSPPISQSRTDLSLDDEDTEEIIATPVAQELASHSKKIAANAAPTSPPPKKMAALPAPDQPTHENIELLFLRNKDTAFKLSYAKAEGRELERITSKYKTDNAIWDYFETVWNDEAYFENFVEECLKEYSKTTIADKTKLKDMHDTLFDHCESLLERLKDASIALARQKRAQHEFITTLSLVNQNANHYKLLRVDRGASLDDIKRSRRQLVVKVHPDKNNGDEDAARCTQALNEAFETLSDPVKRKAYTETLGPVEDVTMANDEDFASNGSGEESEDEVMLEVPPRSESIRNLHAEAARGVQAYFQLKENQDKNREKASKYIEKINQQIKEENEKSGNEPNDYQVDLEELRGLNFVREHILSEKSSYPIEKKRELLEMLHTSYLEVAQRGNHQWPDNWFNYIQAPVLKKLPQLEAAESPGALEKSEQGDTGENKAPDDRANPISTKTENQMFQVYTEEQILGHIPEAGISNKRIFVKIDGENPLAIASPWQFRAEDMDRYPVSGRANDLSKRYRTFHEAFSHIVGIVYDYQRKNTWIWGASQQQRSKFDELRANGHTGDIWSQILDETKAKIMPRTDFRIWVGDKHQADKLCENFYIEREEIPPWARDQEREGSMQSRKNAPQLQYPLPKRKRKAKAPFETIYTESQLAKQDGLQDIASPQQQAREDFSKMLEFAFERAMEKQTALITSTVTSTVIQALRDLKIIEAEEEEEL